MRYLLKMRYLLVVSIALSMFIGCKAGPSVRQETAPDGTIFYFPKSGTSKGGGPVMTGIVVRDKEDGEIIGNASAYSNGPSTTERMWVGALGLGQSWGTAGIGGYFFKEGMKALRPDQGATTTINNSGSNVETNVETNVKANAKAKAKANAKANANVNSESNFYGGHGGEGGGNGGGNNRGGGQGRHNQAPGHENGHENGGRGLGHHQDD